MSFDPNKLSSDPIQRIRLMVGDTTTFPMLEDSVYQFLYLSNNNDELATAIEAAESIINSLVLNPLDDSVGTASQKTRTLREMERRLTELQNKKIKDSSGSQRIPVVIRTDRKDWNDINNIFKR